MTLLDELIEGASGDDVSVATLLRKLKVLASRTAAESLAEWVLFELNGYPPSQDLPEYRGPFEPSLLGHFVGIGGRQVQNFPIPHYIFPDDMKESGHLKLWLGQPVAEIEELAQPDFVNLAWPGDAIALFNHEMRRGRIRRILEEDMVLATLDRPVPRYLYTGILDAVRNRVLDLALSLETQVPRAGQTGVGSDERRHAQQVIHNHFHAATGNVAVASHDFSQHQHLPAPGDEASLMKYLSGLGVSEERLSQLQEALRLDRAEDRPGQQRSPGRRVLAWMGGTMLTVGVGASGDLVANAVQAYFGMR